jgi:hypothetical protein
LLHAWLNSRRTVTGRDRGSCRFDAMKVLSMLAGVLLCSHTLCSSEETYDKELACQVFWQAVQVARTSLHKVGAATRPHPQSAARPQQFAPAGGAPSAGESFHHGPGSRFSCAWPRASGLRPRCSSKRVCGECSSHSSCCNAGPGHAQPHATGAGVCCVYNIIGGCRAG